MGYLDKVKAYEAMEYKIEKNVPMVVLRKPGFSKYPFAQMQIGDSFVAPLEERRRISSAATHYGKNHNSKFHIRKITEKQIRIWRTE